MILPLLGTFGNEFVFLGIRLHTIRVSSQNEKDRKEEKCFLSYT